MRLTRRRVIEVAGVPVASTVIAGCLSSPDPGNGGAGTPTDTDGADDLPRVDDPPDEIDEPDCDPPDDDRDPLWLCADMPTEPTLPFEQVATSGSVLRGEGLEIDDEGNDSQFYATFLTEPTDLDRVDRNQARSAVELIEGTDFDAEAVLVVQTSWGSGSFLPHLERIEATDDGVHAFGCYRRPCVWTDDYTVRTVVARFERPDGVETGVVSLTVDAETRVTFSVGAGVVTVEL